MNQKLEKYISSNLENLKEKLRIAVVCAGDKKKEDSVFFKRKNTRHWKSYEKVAKDIKESLINNGFKNVFLFSEDKNIIKNLEKNNINFAWLNTGGVQGYNSMAHSSSIMEMLGIPYIGHNPLNMTILDNKQIFKNEILKLGIKTPEFVLWNPSFGDYFCDFNKQVEEKFKSYKGTFIVKAISGRTSNHVYYVEGKENLIDYVEKVYKNTSNTVLIEKYLKGREYCIAIYGNTYFSEENLKIEKENFSFSAVERNLFEGEKICTSMDKIPFTNKRFRLLNETEKDLKNKLYDIAKQVYSCLNLDSLIRLDLRMDEFGDLYVLEANPKPDIKKAENEILSIVSMGINEYNMTYDNFILSLVLNKIKKLVKNDLEFFEKDLLKTQNSFKEENLA